MEEILSLLNSNLKTLLIRKIMSTIVAKFAFLGWGPIGFILEQIVEKIVSIALEQINLFVTDRIVDISVNGDVDRVDKITDKLVEYEENKDAYTEEELDELDNELIDAYRDLFNF